MIGAILAVVILAAIAAGLWFGGVLPSREAVAPAPTVTSASTAPASEAPNGAPDGAANPAPNIPADLAARLERIERTIGAQQNQPQLADRLAAVEAQTKALADALKALDRRLDDIAAASQSASQSAGEAANRTNVQKSDLDALAGRIAALESTVKALSQASAHPPPAADQAARLAAAAAALRDAVERGASYRAELEAVAALGVAPGATAPLADFAATGVPSAAVLARQLAALAPDLQRASAKANGATFLDRLEAHAQQLVRITPVDAPAGNAPAAVLARVEVDAAHADIAAALSDIAALPDATQQVAAAWVAKAKAREAAIAAARQIADDALAALAKPVSQ